jgi:hypothetical protein
MSLLLSFINTYVFSLNNAVMFMAFVIILFLGLGTSPSIIFSGLV